MAAPYRTGQTRPCEDRWVWNPCLPGTGCTRWFNALMMKRTRCVGDPLRQEGGAGGGHERPQIAGASKSRERVVVQTALLSA